MSTDVEQVRLAAVIDIGATAIRMAVAEILPDGRWRIIDRAGKPAGLGRDAFRTGSISRETTIQSLQILRGFRELIDGMKIRPEDVKVIGTSALREARNRDTFVDRVALKTGFSVSVVEGIEENRLTYIAVQHALAGLREQMDRSSTVIIEIGGGSTVLMLLSHGKMVAAHSLNIGTVRVEQQLRENRGSRDYLTRFLQENIRNVLDVLGKEIDLGKIDYFVAVGGDARFAAERIGIDAGRTHWVIPRDVYQHFVDELAAMNVEDCVQEFGLTYDRADSLATSLLMYLLFLEGTSADRLIVPNVSIRDGVLINMAAGPDPAVQQEFDSQVLASALSIGRKYHFNEAHACHVAALALTLFDALSSEHGLDAHARLLLEAAGILHDIGTYVKTSGHHKHGQYLVANSEIFGLHRDDIDIISNVVRYHRKTMPMPSHVSYMALSREERVKVLKLSAILRIADALDRGHVQRVIGIKVERTSRELRLRVDHKGDISVERFGISLKAGMFEEVFGLRVALT